ncbi:MAG: preprotein translocase subunit SecA [Planctomycetes bacterium]|nr:preprotein translocase subunit SecA [Planctomycetota bacterium]
MVLSYIAKSVTKVFGTRNDRLIKAYRRRVVQINSLEPEMRRLTDAQLREKTAEYRERIAKGERMANLQPYVMAVAREAMDRSVGIRNIFNPAAGFDSTKLPAELRPLYDEVARRAAAMEPIEELGCSVPVPGWMRVEIPLELYEVVRVLYPVSRPPFRARPFDVQLIGGMVLGEGRIAEMKTGEGKTIVGPLACYTACVESLQCYVVTVNDYLVQRDRDWVFPFYYHLGLTVGAIHPYHMQPPEIKQKAYACNVVYGTNSEFGFDYLRDNMKLTTAEQVQKNRDFCIIDEVDSILIDEARTPLIISGPAHDDAPRYDLADQLARHLMTRQREWDTGDKKVQETIMRIKGLEGDIRNARDKDKIPAMREEMKSLQAKLPELEAARDKYVRYYEVEREKKAAHLTHEGVAEAQKIANIGSFYVGSNMDMPHLLENSLRAHAVYQRDKDYVVQPGAESRELEVIIVDEFTGRLMIGRQWSDGLHQAVEAKEKVKIKQETQTLATVTIQNFFKLFKRLAGMTGTALTESTEFNEIYSLDVVSIPTNVPVVRTDRDDLVFLSQKDKWNAILDEIKQMNDVGRPVLVGTTSVENSEMLSALLAKKHGIKHEVLNAKQHEREAQIVAHAGELGAVMIATNMAGRGTDIKLSPVDREVLVRHWQQHNLLPSDARADMPDEELIRRSLRHQARVALGLGAKEAEALSDEEARLRLLRHWVGGHVPVEPEKISTMSAEQCVAELDAVPGFLLHKLQTWKHVEEMGGLHIVGTERHEARRIDNQLRGRAGRQGDRGSSRFFISLEDDLMKMFAGKTTLTALSKLGMKEGDAIEHRWITGSVGRAQRKVEERNYEIRKNLLEYDEVMEHQRNAFYGLRQDVLEGRNVDRIIFEYIEDCVQDAIALYLDPEYVPSQIAEWCRAQMDVNIETHKLRSDDLHELQHVVRSAASDDTKQTVELTTGEYMSNDIPPEEWDLQGLSSWAMTRFKVDLKAARLRTMNTEEVKRLLTDAALDLIGQKDLSELAKFLDKLYGQRDLAEWVRQKFDIEIKPEEMEINTGEPLAEWRQRVGNLIINKAHESYHRREVVYPVEFIIDMAFQAAQQNGPWAAQQLAGWANQRYDLGWTPEGVTKMSGVELTTQLTAASERWWDGGGLDALVDKALAEHTDTEKLAEWASQRFATKIEPAELADPAARREALLKAGRMLLRTELSQLERFVLLQFLDQAWKEHLYAMDQLRDAVGLRGYAEKDPRIEYKREGANYFRQMQQNVRDHVAETVFRARLTPQVQMRNVYGSQKAQQAPAASAIAAPASDEQRENLDATERAGGGEDAAAMSRKQRRAAEARGDEEEGDDKSKRPQFKERKKKKR